MKSKKRFTMGLVTVVLAGVLLLSGCVTIRSETVINSDLSGSRSIILAISKDMAGLAGGQGSDPFKDAETSVSKIPGATVEPYKTSDKEGIKMVIPFKNLDDLATQQLGKQPSDNMDSITWSQDGDVYTLNITVKTSDVAAKASSGGAGATPQTEQDKAMAQQMIASMGLEFSYAVALPGKIIDWEPKDGATYDAGTNEISWKLDLASSAQPNIVIKWDNAKPAEAIQAPTTAQTTGSAASAMLATLQKYTDAMKTRDEAAVAPLLAPGFKMVGQPSQKLSTLIGARNYQVNYTSMVADENMGAAEWAGTVTVNNKSYNLTGVDVLTFDASGKIKTVQTYFNPSDQLVALLTAK